MVSMKAVEFSFAASFAEASCLRFSKSIRDA
jgi:hypothetical protein